MAGSAAHGGSGQATVQQIDDAIAWGPGLRWALMGPMLTFHLAGGAGGMAHMLDHFGPALLEPWTRLTAPELTPRLRDLVVAGVEEEAGGASIADLEAQRDDFLVDLLELIEKHPPCLSPCWLTRRGRPRRSRATGPRSATTGSTTTAT